MAKPASSHNSEFPDSSASPSNSPWIGEADLLVQATLQGVASLRQQDPRLIPDSTCIIGVSGGRDSVALLHLLHQKLGYKNLIVAHLNHQLRGDVADEDARWVEALATSLSLPFELACVDLRALAKASRKSLETAGREAREDFFLRLSAQYQTPWVFLAHHADDQLETFLGNLFRGCSPKGLLGMQALHQTQQGLIKLRPMLEARRSWITAFVEAEQLSYREDSSNQVADVRRNRLRLELVPLLESIFQRDVHQSTLPLRYQLQDDELFFQHQIQAWFARSDFFDLAKPLEIRISEEFKRLERSLAHRLLFHWMKTYLKISDLSYDLVCAAHAMIQPSAPAKINLPKGRYLRRKQKRLYLEALSTPPSSDLT